MKGIKGLCVLLPLILFPLMFCACASETYASRKEAPDWPVKPPPATEDKIYFVGGSTAENVEKGKKQAVANALGELFAYAFGVSGKAEFAEYVSLKEKNGAIEKIEKIYDSTSIRTAQGDLINVRLADWYWRKDNGNYETWVLLEIEKGSILRAQEEKKNKKLAVEKLLKEAKNTDLENALKILASINPETIDGKSRFDYQEAVMKVAQNIGIEVEREEADEVVFKVFSKKGPKKIPLSGVPVTCQIRGEDVGKDWSDNFGHVQCPKTAPFATKLIAQIFAPFGTKTILESSLRFALLRTDDDSPGYTFLFKKFREVLLQNKVLFTEIKVPKSSFPKNQTFWKVIGIEAELEKNTRLVIVLELTSNEASQTYDPHDPANYYYTTKFNVTAKTEAFVSLFSVNQGRLNEVFTRIASNVTTSIAGLETQRDDLAATIAKSASLVGEELGRKFIQALYELE